jgi:thiamine kinase-like enzyme
MLKSIMSLEACLPAHLRGTSTRISEIAAGLSGAGVYRVEAAGQVFVLKIAGADKPLISWQQKLHIQQLAANSGLAPRVVHVDEERRAVVSGFVLDQSFPAFYGNPNTREAALVQVGQTVRRVHKLPLPLGTDVSNPLEFLANLWSELELNFALPAFVSDAVRRLLAEEAPLSERPLVLSHNDVNPTNLVYDGENLMLLDWETASLNDPFYDLAAISVFLRMDEETCQRLLAAYDDEPVCKLPTRFIYSRRLAAGLCGTMLLRLARQSGHGGATGEDNLSSAPTLGDFYQRLRTGSLSLATGEGQWSFGLALIKDFALPG